MSAEMGDGPAYRSASRTPPARVRTCRQQTGRRTLPVEHWGQCCPPVWSATDLSATAYLDAVELLDAVGCERLVVIAEGGQRLLRLRRRVEAENLVLLQDTGDREELVLPCQRYIGRASRRSPGHGREEEGTHLELADGEVRVEAALGMSVRRRHEDRNVGHG